MLSRLSELTVDQKARVVNVDAPDELGQRILEMGMTPGIEVRMVGTAPLGDPLIYEVRGYRLALRRTEAERVEVERP